MSARGFVADGFGFAVHWFGGFAVAELPAGRDVVTAPALAAELCAVLEAGAAGLIVYLPFAGACDSACLDALMRAARRARGWGAWLRVVIPDPGARRVVRLVALDAVMPAHASVTGAIAAAREAAAAAAGGNLPMCQPSGERCPGSCRGRECNFNGATQGNRGDTK